MTPKVASYEIDADKPKPEGETRRRRGYCVRPDEPLLTSPTEGVHTIHDLIEYCVRTHGERNAVGYRDTIREHVEEKEVKGPDGKPVKKKWTYFELSDYKYLSWNQVGERIRNASSGLAHLGLKKGQTFNVYAQTALSWQVMAQAAIRQSVTICTAYDSLGPSGLTHSLNEPDVTGVFTNADLLSTVLEVLPDTPTVKMVIYDGQAKPDVLEKLQAIKRGDGDGETLKIVHLDELERLGKENPAPAVPPHKDDTVCIMYTSGSTGAPKGVVLSHENLVSGIAAIRRLLDKHLQQSDSLLAYLPLAHILEFILEMAFMFIGITLGYGRVKTLTDASVRNCVGDIRAFRPTLLVGVPAVWELIRKGILAKVNAAGMIKRSVFNAALSAKKSASSLGLPGVGAVTDAVVFNAIKQGTGGRLRLAMSGGAAISKETQEFLSTALVTVLQGYGMTESCGMCAILSPEFMSFGPAGVPMPSIEVKLVDAPEAGYFSTNALPQGEIQIRGPSVTKGYFKRPDVDAEAFTSDGWFKTGDIGQFNKDGTLSIIDRLKNLVKLQGGEYIALERLESTYKSNPLVANICIIANNNAKQPAAIVVVNEAHLKNFLKSNSLGHEDSIDAAVHDRKVAVAVLKDLNAAGKKAGFKPLEQLETVILTAEEWTPQSGLVTAAQKIQRKAIEKHFADDIKKYYNH